jgi:hypothetical protein
LESNVLQVAFELGTLQSSYVFNKQCLWSKYADRLNKRWQHVALVILPQVLARNAERLARRATGKQSEVCTRRFVEDR